jgi:hypothetical protein
MPTAKIPYKLVRGDISQRQKQANSLTDKLFESLKKDIADDYTLFSFSDLNKKIYDILPDKNFKIKIHTLNDKRFGALTENIYNKKNKKIDAICIDIPAIKRSIRPLHLTYLIHEFQHVTDQIYNPKYAARAQKININKLYTQKYNNFYDKYFYHRENCKTKKDKRKILDNIKKETLKFLEKYTTSEKLDYLQDTRYSMESEINAYKQEIKTAEKLKKLKLKIHKGTLSDFPKKAILKEKIELIKEIAFEIIKKERTEHANSINKKL